MPRVEVAPGYWLNVETSGRGPALVLLHGFTGSARSWGRFGNLLSAHFTLVAVDIAGHGGSDKPAEEAPYRMPRVAADLVAAVRLTGRSEAAWLGYSMGGRTALTVAALFPDAVQRLVLIGASAGIADAAERARRVTSDNGLADRIVADGVQAFVDYWESTPLFASQRSLPEDIRTTIRNGRLACDANGLANSLRGMGTGAQEPLHERLSTIGMPVLALAGEDDARYATVARELATSIPRGRAATVPAAGHAAHIENPEWCAAVVQAFLQDLGEGQ